MSLNKVMLIGNVGSAPEVKYVDNGVCTAQISLATSTPGYTLQMALRFRREPSGIEF